MFLHRRSLFFTANFEIFFRYSKITSQEIQKMFMNSVTECKYLYMNDLTAGAPSEQQTYEYAKTILSLMTQEKHPQGKVLIIGGGIANFTNVAATFRGIITALVEFQGKLIEHKISIFVRRAGPNYQEGLRRMREVGQTLCKYTVTFLWITLIFFLFLLIYCYIFVVKFFNFFFFSFFSFSIFYLKQQNLTLFFEWYNIISSYSVVRFRSRDSHDGHRRDGSGNPSNTAGEQRGDRHGKFRVTYR